MYRLSAYGSMLRDTPRLTAYTRALQSVVTPRSVVLDLGSGIGTFAMLAARFGAARVYAVEPADVITVAEEIARANGLADRIRFIQARASEAMLPEEVDVIVADLSGALPLFEEHIPSVISMRDRFLAPGGVMIPARDRLMCAPVSKAALHAELVEPWRALDGIDFRAAETMVLNSPYALAVAPEDLAGVPQCWGELAYATITSPNVSSTLEWQFDAPADIHGIALWFECTLVDGIGYSTGPWAPGSVHSTIVLPLREPLQGEKRMTLSISSSLAAGRYVTTWQAGLSPRQSTFLGETHSRGSLLDRAETVSDAGMKTADTFRICNEVLSRPVGDEVLLFDPRSGLYHVLNETGARVWHGLENAQRVDDIAAAVAAEYEVDEGRAAADVEAVIAGLQEAKLIE